MSDFFISYSRKDKDFVLRLVDALEERGREVWVDLDSIRPMAEWAAEICAGIEGADNFVFVISPESVASRICGWEVAHAVKNNKRLIPILRREVDREALQALMADAAWEGVSRHDWNAVAALHWISFRDQDDSDSTFRTLIVAADTDLDYVRTHSRLLVSALEWGRRGSKDSDTLRGVSLEQAKQWLAASAGEDPQPTELHRRFITAGLKARRKRRIIAMAATTLALIVVVILSMVAYNQFRGRLEQEGIAEAEQEQRRLLELAASARQVFEDGDPGLALALAVAANEGDKPPPAAQLALAELAYQPGTMRLFRADNSRSAPSQSGGTDFCQQWK